MQCSIVCSSKKLRKHLVFLLMSLALPWMKFHVCCIKFWRVEIQSCISLQSLGHAAVTNIPQPQMLISCSSCIPILADRTLLPIVLQGLGWLPCQRHMSLEHLVPAIKSSGPKSGSGGFLLTAHWSELPA